MNSWRWLLLLWLAAPAAAAEPAKKPEKRTWVLSNTPSVTTSPDEQYSALVSSAVVEIKLGRPETALRLVRKAKALLPERPEAHLLQGRILYDRGRRAAAREAFEQSLAFMAKDDPRQRYAFERLGRIGYLEDKCVEAKRNYTLAIELSERLDLRDHAAADAHVGMGFCLEQAGLHDEAAKMSAQGEAWGPSEELKAELALKKGPAPKSEYEP